ncbi:MAG: SDR family oxidoreductase [Putridiphycobacter sp.]|nr:SDR family oxidoreductase [Putridiphycobacter sp.]
MKILITGSNGLLGQKIVKQCLSKAIDFIASSQGDNRNSACPAEKYRVLDITNYDQIERLFIQEKPTHIINTAAVTNVDYCESNQDQCQAVNVTAVSYLLEVSERFNCHLTHLSTDFVFDGEDGPYSEDDKVNPLSVYAKSKVDSEALLLTSDYKNWSILRTIIVFGEGENLSRSNIVLWAKQALEKGDPLTIVDDQFRAPTWADDLAWACIQSAKLSAKGIYHIAGPETFSIYELVKKVAQFYHLDYSQVSAIKSAALNQAAKRPPKTGFNLKKARNKLGYAPKTFEEALALLQN